MATSPVSSVANPLLPILPASGWPTPPLQKKNGHDLALVPEAISRPAPQNMAAAREQILLENLTTVRYVARRIHERLPQHVEMEDLVSAGVIGLIDAFNKFDGAKNVQFGSYAQFRIRGAILDSLRSLDWGPRELRRKGRKIEEVERKLTQQVGCKPSESEIAAELGMALQPYQALLGELKSLEIGSLNQTRSADSMEEELEYLADKSEESPFTLYEKSEMTSDLNDAIATLPEREARILAMYYVEEMTLKEIGAALGLVESRVSQIRTSAIANLRAWFARGKKNVKRREGFS